MSSLRLGKSSTAGFPEPWQSDGKADSPDPRLLVSSSSFPCFLQCLSRSPEGPQPPSGEGCPSHCGSHGGLWEPPWAPMGVCLAAFPKDLALRAFGVRQDLQMAVISGHRRGEWPGAQTPGVAPGRRVGEGTTTDHSIDPHFRHHQRLPLRPPARGEGQLWT